MLNKVLIIEDYEDREIRPMINPEQVEQFVDMLGDYDYPVFEIIGICMSRLDAINDLVIDPSDCESTEALEKCLRKVHPNVKVKTTQDYEKVRHAIMFDTYSRQAFDLIDAEWIYGYEYTETGKKEVFRIDSKEDIVISTKAFMLYDDVPSKFKIHKVYELDNNPVTDHFVVVEYDNLGSYETARFMTSNGDLIAWLMDYFKSNRDPLDLAKNTLYFVQMIIKEVAQ